jgi:hypothetical protein
LLPSLKVIPNVRRALQYGTKRLADVPVIAAYGAVIAAAICSVSVDIGQPFEINIAWIEERVLIIYIFGCAVSLAVIGQVPTAVIRLQGWFKA